MNPPIIASNDYKQFKKLCKSYNVEVSQVLDLLTFKKLSNTSLEIIKVIFAAIPPGVAALDLSINWLGNKTVAELIQIFEAIPPGVTALDLHTNGLGYKTVAELVQIFTAIPPGVTALDLSCNQLENKTGAELAQAFAAIPPGVTSLNLSGELLGNKTGPELAQAFAAIPTSVTAINLSGNLLGNKTGPELAQAFAAIPTRVTALNLSCNQLANKTGSELAQAFAAIPTSVTALDLSGNLLGNKTGAELVQIFAAIPHDMTALNLSCNGLGHKTVAELVEIFAVITSGVTELNLRGNWLGMKTVAELIQIFAAISPGLTELDLSGNWLMNKTGAELAQAFAAIPPRVTTLNLSGNQLGNKTGAELVQIFEAIPSNVTAINLSGNQLGNKTRAELAQAFAAIPPGVSTIQLTSDDLRNLLNQKSIDGCLLFFKNLPNSVTKLIVDGILYSPPIGYIFAISESQLKSPIDIIEAQAIKPLKSIDESNLLQLLEMFEEHPTPQYDLLSAYLLEGRIENYASYEKIEEQAATDYINQRRLFALNFYQRAACHADETLAHNIEEVMLIARAKEPNDSPIYHKLSTFTYSQEKAFKESREGKPSFITTPDTLSLIDWNGLRTVLEPQTQEYLTTNQDLNEEDALQLFIAHYHKLFPSESTQFSQLMFRTQDSQDNSNLKKILQHAMESNNLNRVVCIELGWLNKAGQISRKAPAIIKEQFKQNPSPG